MKRYTIKRRGSVLLVVLVIVMLLTLGAYAFTELMIVERGAAVMHGQSVRTRVYCDSGVEYAAALLGDRVNLVEVNLYHDPALFGNVLVYDGGVPGEQGRFSIVSPVESDPTAQAVRFGLIDESGKLNLNALLSMDLEDSERRTMLMYVPGMTEDVADAILDWLDDDFELREFGAEDETYTTLPVPYPTKNGPLESLEELLLVRGVTPQLLFGEDANRNGLLDMNENDGEFSPPLDNADGLLDPGWSAYFTIYSREANVRADGSPKINLNESLLTTLYEDVAAEFGEEVAQFVVAYRMNGASNREEELEPRSFAGESSGSGAELTAEEEEAMQDFSEGIASALVGGSEGSVTRGGMDLSEGGSVEINSIYDLIDAEVEAEIDGATQTLTSPWTSGSMQEDLPILFDAFTVTDAPYIHGRINVNQCRRETLLGIPGMTEQIADAIVAAQMVGTGSDALTAAGGYRATTGWLVMEGLVDLAQMRQLDPFLTTRGDVYRVQVVGHHDGGGPATRVEAVIDATEFPAKVVFQRDLTELGRGYSDAHLNPAAAAQAGGL